jgi:hypothetical protein
MPEHGSPGATSRPCGRGPETKLDRGYSWERFAPTLGEQGFPALTLGRRGRADLHMVGASRPRRERS